MKKTIATFLLAAAFAATLVFAQAPGNPANPPNPGAMVQHRIARLTALLNLTPDQQQQATTIFTNAATSSRDLRMNMRTARQTMHTAVQNNDTNTINQSSTAIGNLTAQLTQTRATAQAAFYHLLTPDQQTKLNAFSGGRHHRRFRGPGPR